MNLATLHNKSVSLGSASPAVCPELGLSLLVALEYRERDCEPVAISDPDLK